MTVSTEQCRDDATLEHVYVEHVTRVFTAPEDGLGHTKNCQPVYGLESLPDGIESWDCTQISDSISTGESCVAASTGDFAEYKTLRVDGEAPGLIGCKLYTSNDCSKGDQGDSTTWRMLQNNGTQCVQIAHVGEQNLGSFECVSLLAQAVLYEHELIADPINSMWGIQTRQCSDSSDLVSQIASDSVPNGRGWSRSQAPGRGTYGGLAVPHSIAYTTARERSRGYSSRCGSSRDPSRASFETFRLYILR